MKRVEERLMEQKEILDSMPVPEELEARLRNALNHTQKRKNRKKPMWLIAVVALLFLSVFGYHYNAFAYYSKQIFGFDELLTDTLKDLNNQGLGQKIEKKTLLADGTELTIKGIMADETQLILYYVLSNPNGIDEDLMMTSSFRNITGFFTNSSAVSGTSIINLEGTEVKGTMSFDPVNPFAKKLTLHYDQQLNHNQQVTQTITFPFNPNEALQSQLKQSIKKKFSVDKGHITFNTITATPISTVIEGTFNIENFDRVDMAFDGIQLIANGSSIPLIGSGSHSALKGRKFELRYDALPKQLDSLQLVINKFVGYEKLEEKIPLTPHTNEPIRIHQQQELWVKEVKSNGENIEITIATEFDVMLDRVSIETDIGEIPLQTTINQTKTTAEDGRTLKQRTLLFHTTENPKHLLIKGMHYMKLYDYMVEIR
ncbi:DUF4179 domain-containing protein [Pseudoneobacillus sp. C159]